ncbi:Dyp-type peroxidase [Candidatus Nanopelagicales bacterium]|nr:Dyp-type peroxidase [Candidatus Nanopelagicales bacterium]
MAVMPQTSIFVEETALHYHLELNLRPGATDADVVVAVRAARRIATGNHFPNAVWGFNPDLWRRLEPGGVPSNVMPFQGIRGTGGVAPQTQSDIWFWCNGNAYEKLWQTAYAVLKALEPVAVLERQLSAFIGRDNRDPSGFIDGTENPALDEALEISVVPDSVPGAGGIPIFVQKWIHRMTAFEALPVAEQERVFGRTKEESVQLPPAQMPATSHVSRNTILDADGEEMHIYRRNTPYAQMDEIGSLFIGCAADPGRIDLMLERMFGATADGLIDNFTKYSDAVSGSYYFAPSMNALTAVFGSLNPDDDDADVQDPVSADAAGGGTSDASGDLRIGSLRDVVGLALSDEH